MPRRLPSRRFWAPGKQHQPSTARCLTPGACSGGERRPGAFDLLFELKLVRREKLGKTTGQQLREMDDSALRALPAVEAAFDEARQQAGRYRAALVKERGDEVELRSYVVVAVGPERLLGEEATKEK